MPSWKGFLNAEGAEDTEKKRTAEKRKNEEEKKKSLTAENRREFHGARGERKWMRIR
jgi:hypothetical protein